MLMAQASATQPLSDSAHVLRAPKRAAQPYSKGRRTSARAAGAERTAGSRDRIALSRRGDVVRQHDGRSGCGVQRGEARRHAGGAGTVLTVAATVVADVLGDIFGSYWRLGAVLVLP
jgi:hypothetical protein